MSARLNFWNVVGVVKPVNPDGRLNGNAADPAAARCALAVSSSAETKVYAESLVTNGAGAAVTGTLTAMGIESWLRAISTMRNEYACIVSAKPRVAFCSCADRAEAVPITFSRLLVLRIAA